MAAGSVNMMVYNILSYCQKLDPNTRIKLDDLDNQVILQAISVELPNYVHSKNLEYFYDNTVWYYGTDGDIRAVIFDSFQEALNMLKQSQPQTAKEAVTLLEEFIATYQESEKSSSENTNNDSSQKMRGDDNIEEKDKIDSTVTNGITNNSNVSTVKLASGHSILDTMSGIMTIILFTLSAYAIIKGVILLPVICSATGIIAIIIALIIRIRWARYV